MADGIHSPLRRQLLPDSAPRYVGYACWRAVFDWPGHGLTEATETWGSRGRVGIVPLAGDQVYWFACVNAPAQDLQIRRQSSRKLADRFAHYHNPVANILACTPDENLIGNDIIDLKPLPRYAFGRTLLLGDAAYTAGSNLGNGACRAIEKAVLLADELAHHDAPEHAFAAFEQRQARPASVAPRSRAFA